MPDQRSSLAFAVLVTVLVAACSARPAPTPVPTSQPSPAPTSVPASPTPSPSPEGRLVSACLQQVSEPEGVFPSYVLASVTLEGQRPDQVLLLIDGANDDQAASLSLNEAASAWQGHLGMRAAGPKRIDRLFVVYPDGTGADMTLSMAEQIGGLFIEFGEGGTDAFGTCDL